VGAIPSYEPFLFSEKCRISPGFHFPAPRTELKIHCHHCGSDVPDLPVGRGEILRCGLCQSTLKKYCAPGAHEAACSLAICALVILWLANSYPIMIFSVAGNVQSNEIITGIQVLMAQGYWPIALLVLFCAIVAPGLYFAGVAYASAACALRSVPPGAAAAARLARKAQPWSLLPVFAMACVVSAVKLDLIGQVEWQAGVWLVAILAMNALILGSLFDPEEALRIFDEHNEKLPVPVLHAQAKP
jgi:paraquat-inducible protein A